MIRAARIWRLQRVSGIFSALALALAFLCLFDGLRGGVFGSQSPVPLIPGEAYRISGPMPSQTEHIKDFVVDGNAPGGTVRLKPQALFTGYWFGGGMWRGEIAVDQQCLPGAWTFSVRDNFGGKQNPALVFSVRVFRDEADRQAHSASAIIRWTGLQPLMLAACLGAAGLLAMGLNYLFGRLWSRVLAELGCGEVYRMRVVDGHREVGVEFVCRSDVQVGEVFRFTHPQRGNLGTGVVIDCGKCLTLKTEASVPVQLGDIACPQQM